MNTSQHQTLNYPPIWRRFAAIVYDSLLVTAVSMGYGALSLGIGIVFFKDQEVITSSIFFQLGWAVVIIGFFCFFWMKAGQTLGMQAWRLKVFKEETTQSPSLLQCVFRCLLAPLGLSLCFIALLRQDKQCIHDLLSHTQIVLTEKTSK